MNKKILISRDISWLSFNARVLQEANDPTLPLKERIRFLAIFSNNQDEFFRVRVAVLKKLIKFNDKKNKMYLGKNPQKILESIHGIILRQQDEFNRIWKRISIELKKEKIFLIDDKHLTAKQKVFVRDFFEREISPSIIPLFIEDMSQLPSFGDDHIFLGIVMQKNQEPLDKRFAVIQIPTNSHSRFVILPSSSSVQNIMLLEDVIRFNLSSIFSHLGYTHFEAHMFKVTKDAEIGIDQDVSTTFIQKIEMGVKNRRKAVAIRFLYDKRMNAELLELLIRKFNLTHRDSIIPGGAIRNFRDFIAFPATLPDLQPRQLPFKPPALAKSLRVCDVILRQDILLHFPYHSFISVIDLLREAAMDPDVKSIKITAYRLAHNSKICNALIYAARNGKQVHVVLELRASFNEQANLDWKAKLEEEGVKVFVGIPNIKVHAKICVIKKQIGKQTVQFGFVGTGNLNEETALGYTDHLLMTSNREMMADLNRIFKVLENPGATWRRRLGACKTLIISPVNMRQSLLSMIDREMKCARSGVPAKIIINLNSLSDRKLIKKLYAAAKVGVEVKLIIRGIFCVQIDQPEFVRPMTAISIVDKYLEHSRIWLFHNAGHEDIYISSADWRLRNLDYRLEVAVPIKDKGLKNELKHILKVKLSDNVKARVLDNALSNHYVPSVGARVHSQRAIYSYLKRKRL